MNPVSVNNGDLTLISFPSYNGAGLDLPVFLGRSKDVVMCFPSITDKINLYDLIRLVEVDCKLYVVQ